MIVLGYLLKKSLRFAVVTSLGSLLGHARPVGAASSRWPRTFSAHVGTGRIDSRGRPARPTRPGDDERRSERWREQCFVGRSLRGDPQAQAFFVRGGNLTIC